jgi:hypothetical protein
MGLVAVLCQAQSPAPISVSPQGPPVIRSYETPLVPPVRLKNSAHIRSLLRAGKLYLTLQDAIALASRTIWIWKFRAMTLRSPIPR